MSVKTMTNDQIRNDLATIVRQWPEGVPVEQYDRVNALKGELKRRGEDIVAPTKPQAPSNSAQNDPASMSDGDLQAELRQLSTRISSNPGDEDAQNRFADLRYEVRRRGKASGGNVEVKQEQPTRAPLPSRALELPQDAQEQPERVVPRRTTPTGVCGYVADAGGRGVTLKHTSQHTSNDASSVMQVVSSLSVEEAEMLVAMVQSAIEKAKAAQ